MKIVIQFLIFSILTYSFIFQDVTFADDEWTLVKNKKGIAVYSKNQAVSKYKEIKSIVTIDADIDTILSIYRDFESYPKWQYFMKTIKVINCPDDSDNLFAYASYDFPWPISNRDIVINTKLNLNDKQKKTVTLQITNCLHPDFPEDEKTIRVKNYHCVALLEAIDKDQTRVTYTIKADPGGNIPSIAVNLVGKEAQYMTLKKLRKIALNKMNLKKCPATKQDSIINASIK